MHSVYAGRVPKHVQIRNVPDAVVDELKRRAALAGQSLSEYLLRELERLAGRPSRAEVLRRIRERDGLVAGVTTQQVVDAIHEGRARADVEPTERHRERAG